MKKTLFVLLSFFFFFTLKMSAQSAWLGKWITDPMEEGTEKMIMEFDFKNDTEMSVAFYTDNKKSGLGRCVSKVSANGTYTAIGPLFFMSIDSKSVNVEILKLTLDNSHIKVTKSAIAQQIKATASILFANFEDVEMVYVTHDDPNVISFIIGDEQHAEDMEFHRPEKPIEQILGF